MSNLTQEQVDNLNNFQNEGKYHPFTCLHDGGDKHILYEFNKLKLDKSYNQYINDEIEKRMPYPHMEFTQTNLIATKDGKWICPVCDYTQPIHYNKIIT